MRRIDLEHIIRAAGDIANDDELIVIGSQAILAQERDFSQPGIGVKGKTARKRGA